MVNKKRGFLLVLILLFSILSFGCQDSNLNETALTEGNKKAIELFEKCYKNEKEGIISHDFFFYEENGVEKDFIASSHLCFINGFITCAKPNSYNLEYCTSGEVNDLLDNIYDSYKRNLPTANLGVLFLALTPFQFVYMVTHNGDTIDLLELVDYFFSKKLSDIFKDIIDSAKSDYWIKEINSIFPEEDISPDLTSNNLILTKISEYFLELNNRNVLNVETVAVFNDEQGNPKPAVLIPCNSKSVNKIIEHRLNSDTLSFEYGELSEAYLCVNTGSDDKKEKYKWIRLIDSDFSSNLDFDEDSVPKQFDCNDNNPLTFGNYFKYGGNPKGVPIPLCGDSENNTCDIIENEVDNCNDNEEACKTPELNVFGESFSWIATDTATKGFCCGYNGIDDNGEIVEEYETGKDYLCVKETETSSSEDYDGNTEPTNEVSWELLTATSSDNKFKIKTIIKPGEQPFDIVSNNKDWIKCDAEKELSVGSFSAENQVANNFYCFQEGNKWSWAECCSENTECFNLGTIKERNTGEGAYTLTLMDNNFYTNVYDESVQNDYQDIYQNDYPDFTNYENLEFYLTFTSEEEISKRTRVILQVRGEDGDYFNENVLGYVINGATFEKDKLMHVKIPISDWENVQQIYFKTVPSSSTFKIEKLHLTKTNNKFCSGLSSAEKSSWINDLDDWDEDTEGEISGKEACMSLYNNWNDNLDVEDQNRCCGNDENEYSTENACWNSLSVAEAQPVTNVKINLKYHLGEWTYTYPEILASVNYNIKYVEGVEILEETLTDGRFEGEVSYQTSLERIGKIEINKAGVEKIYLSNGEGARFSLVLNQNAYKDDGLLNKMSVIEADDLVPGVNKILVLAEVDKIERSYNYNEVSEELTYTCTSSDCVLSLKGSSPYMIENVYPNKYDLYYVYDRGRKKVLIDEPKSFYSENGWLEINNLPLQVIYDEDKFFSCGNTDFLNVDGIELEEQNYCSIKAENHFCDYAEGWKFEDIDPLYVYEGNQDSGYDLVEDPLGRTILSADRTHFSSIVFGRNLLLNPWLG